MCNHWWWNLTRVTSLSEFHCTECWEPICRTMNHMFLTCGVLWFTVNLLSTLSELHFMAHKKNYCYVDSFLWQMVRQTGHDWAQQLEIEGTHQICIWKFTNCSIDISCSFSHLWCSWSSSYSYWKKPIALIVFLNLKLRQIYTLMIAVQLTKNHLSRRETLQQIARAFLVLYLPRTQSWRFT